MDDIVRWNNMVLSAKSCTFSVAGVPYVGILAVDYEDQLDAELVHGANKDGSPIGYTSGEYSITSFTMQVLKDVWIARMQPQLALMSAAMGAPGSYGGAVFPFAGQYQEGPLVGIDLINGCRVTKVKDSYAQGAGKLAVDLSLMALTIRRNGLTLYNPLRIP